MLTDLTFTQSNLTLKVCTRAAQNIRESPLLQRYRPPLLREASD